MKKILLVLLISIATTLAVAQNERTIEIPGRQCQSCAVRYDYDRFKDLTTLTLKPLNVYKGPNAQLYLFFQGEHQGKTPQSPMRQCIMALNVVVTDKDFEATNSELLGIVDAKRTSFGKLIMTDRIAHGVFYRFEYGVKVSRTMVAQLATANKVEMRFSGMEFELTNQQRLAILDFLSAADGELTRPSAAK